MAHDPDLAEQGRTPDTSHALDMVALHRSQGMDGRMEADLIHGVLESNGIYSIVSGTSYPPLGFEVKVARADLAAAQRLVQEAQDSGSSAADEAEAESETKDDHRLPS